MSGIYIPGMEMPTSCFGCALLDYAGTYKCRIGFISLTKEHGINISRPPLCPLVPVPDHGDLIDRDKLMGAKLPNNRAYQGDERISYPPTVWQILDSISKAPTIIPADKEVDS